ncbi:MAG: hypothetical protein SAL70_15480 [Scytonema sp. PMC 1070.18]|nr:hypothetical protein [Scytonema sp. PMC 1070.18]
MSTKVSRTVLRGLRDGDIPMLPDRNQLKNKQVTTSRANGGMTWVKQVLEKCLITELQPEQNM